MMQFHDTMDNPNLVESEKEWTHLRKPTFCVASRYLQIGKLKLVFELDSSIATWAVNSFADLFNEYVKSIIASNLLLNLDSKMDYLLEQFNLLSREYWPLLNSLTDKLFNDAVAEGANSKERKK